MKTVFLKSREDVKWLRDTHLPKDAPKFRYAVVDGNEDSPSKVTLYNRNHYQAIPAAVYVADEDGNLQRA